MNTQHGHQFADVEELLTFLSHHPVRSCSVHRDGVRDRATLRCSRHIDPYGDDAAVLVDCDRDQLAVLDDRGVLPLHVAASLRRRGMIVPRPAPSRVSRRILEVG